MFKKNIGNLLTASAMGATLLVGLNATPSSAQEPDDIILADVDFEKTVYYGHDSGSSCGSNNQISVPAGKPVTYCYTVTNVAGSPLSNLLVDDQVFSTNEALTTVGNDLVLEVGESVQYYIEGDAPAESTSSEAVLTADGLDVASGEVAFGFSARSGVDVTVEGVVPAEQSVAAAPPEILGERPVDKTMTTAAATTQPVPQPTTTVAPPVEQTAQAAAAEVDETLGSDDAKADDEESGDELAYTGPREIAIVAFLGTVLMLGGALSVRRERADKYAPQLVAVKS